MSNLRKQGGMDPEYKYPYMVGAVSSIADFIEKKINKIKNYMNEKNTEERFITFFLDDIENDIKRLRDLHNEIDGK